VLGILLFFGLAADIGKQIWKQCHTQTILIEPFAVSPDLEKFGYSSKVIAILLVDKCDTIIKSTQTGVNPGKFTRTEDESYPDIDVPETHVSLKTFANYITEHLGYHPTRIMGEFVGPTNQLTLTMRIDPASVSIPKMEGTLGNLDQLLNMAVTNILRQTHPYDLACHLYDMGETNEALEMVQKCIEGSNMDDKAWAHILWGVILLDQNQYKEAAEKFNKAANFKASAYCAYCNLAVRCQPRMRNWLVAP
jgi:hypothetical protein